MRKTIDLLGLLLAGVFLSGCMSSEWRTRSISNSSSLAGKATIVVPVKGAAIALWNLEGYFGDEVAETNTETGIQKLIVVNKEWERLDKLSKELNIHASDFSPEVILAGECVDILHRGSWSLRWTPSSNH